MLSRSGLNSRPCRRAAFRCFSSKDGAAESRRRAGSSGSAQPCSRLCMSLSGR